MYADLTRSICRELHYIILLAEQHGTDCAKSPTSTAPSVGTWQYAERLSDEEIEPLRQLYADQRQGAWPANQQLAPEPPVQGHLPAGDDVTGIRAVVLVPAARNLDIAPFNDGVIRPHA